MADRFNKWRQLYPDEQQFFEEYQEDIKSWVETLNANVPDGRNLSRMLDVLKQSEHYLWDALQESGLK